MASGNGKSVRNSTGRETIVGTRTTKAVYAAGGTLIVISPTIRTTIGSLATSSLAGKGASGRINHNQIAVVTTGLGKSVRRGIISLTIANPMLGKAAGGTLFLLIPTFLPTTIGSLKTSSIAGNIADIDPLTSSRSPKQRQKQQPGFGLMPV